MYIKWLRNGFYMSKIAAIKIHVLELTFIYMIDRLMLLGVADIPSILKVMHHVESCIIIL